MSTVGVSSSKSYGREGRGYADETSPMSQLQRFKAKLLFRVCMFLLRLMRLNILICFEI